MLKQLALTLGLTSLIIAVSSPISAVQLADGTVSFNKSPRLVDAITTFKGVWVSAAKYYFRIDIPEDAGEPLGKITIQQKPAIETIQYTLDKTVVFAGTYTHRGESFQVKSVQWDEATNTMTIIIDPPIPPGTSFTLGLKPIRNPWYDGIYLFGVKVFPAGEKSSGLYLGVGRLQFYNNGGLW